MPSFDSWGWATEQTVRPNFPGDLLGQTIDLTGTYTDLKFRDGETSSGDQGIHYVESQDSSTWHSNDGVDIDGHIYEIDKFYTYQVTINYADGTSIDSNIIAMRLVDDPDHGTSGDNGTYHTKLVFRLHDDAIPAAEQGADGEGGKSYGVNGIDSITVNSLAGQPVRQHNANINDGFICFGKGTLIETPDGPVAVEDLRVGDLVRTLDHGAQPIRWIGSRHYSARQLAHAPKMLPIRIEAGALGDNRPTAPLIVSPQHCVLLESRLAHRIFSTDQILVPAKNLVGLPGIEVLKDVAEMAYYHLLLDGHELLWSNGTLTESLYMGPQALYSISPEGVEEIRTLFPEMFSGETPMVPARMFAQKNKEVRRLVEGLAGGNRPRLPFPSRNP